MYLLTLGLLGMIFIHAKDIQNLHFMCFLESVLLESFLLKGHDKRCRKTSTLIKSIFVTLVHLNAVPSFVLCRTPSCPEAKTIPVPDPVFTWTRA